MICRQCGQEFQAIKSRRFFCGKACHSASMRRFDIQSLAELAKRGELAKNIAVDLGICRARVHRALRTYGLHRLWLKKREQRYGAR